ncbi:patatin [Parashewanella spongiae]|uniref:Patatin n=1 Tax=Parashewanella spongiae TaxID=342950 RepID=A0A3A6U3P6_9GAMM|nr:patatin-like phospholipase family protein [Parashewanella spongiae]MCL1077061.1 patatin-like phospholipase family protein [Parashewanella spongiae]RJY18725.1 patatin [Parashewanella spongiae]
MFSKRVFISFIALLAFCTSAQARPKIGLVLSGGGAKGAAHIGVLKILEQNNIPVDYIAGTSIGAYVGGMYALGYSANEIEQLMLHSDWNKGYSDSIPRQSLSYRDKQQRDQFNVPISIGLNEGQVETPSGLLQGQNMSMLFRDSTNLVHEFSSFDQLAIPFRAVATDLASSNAVVLDSGSMIFAMQASATVPGALEPAKWQDKLLIDGGIANNMPVDVVKAMGADIIIAVDIGSSLAPKNALTSTIAVLNQLSTILTNASTDKQKALLSNQDFLIRPVVGQMSTTDFSILPEALKLGESAATILLPKLKALSISDENFAKYALAKSDKRKQWFDPIKQPVTQIVLNNHSTTNDSVIYERLQLKKGQVISQKQLSSAIERVYSLNEFERVNAEFTDTDAGRILTITTKAKSWGPNYFQLGLNWEDDFNLGSSTSVSLAYTLTDITDNGGEWRNELKLGYEKLLATEFYQPLDLKQKFYAKLRYQFDKTNQTIFENNDAILGLERSTNLARLGVGYNLTQNTEIEIGFRGLKGTISNNALSDQDVDTKGYGGYINLGYDNLNSISFPTDGDRFTLQVRFGRDDVTQGNEDFSSHFTLHYLADWKGALSFGNHGFVGKLSLETQDTDLNELVPEPAELGGFLNLSGYHKNSLIGNHKIFGAFIYQYDLSKDVFGLDNFPLYLGASIEAGNVWLNKDSVDLDDLIYSGSLYLGIDTELGPAALALGFTDDNEHAIYLFVGKNF